MRTNVNNPYKFGSTFEGAPAKRITDEQALRRSVMSCLLWEKEAYEDGQKIADRITDLADKLPALTVARTAIEARHTHHLRHVPLLLLLSLLKKGDKDAGDTIATVLSRPDELGELVSLYWARGNKKMLPNQLKRGLSKALLKFDEYRLAKWNQDGAVKLRDVLFLSHAKPDTEARADLWKRLAQNELKTPDTWEVALSGGANKRMTFERLISEGNLGYLALLRNLRNMVDAGCDLDLVREAIVARKNGADKVLPFRFIAAARAAKQLEPALDQALLATIGESKRLEGKTIILVDVSGSMDTRLSAKSDLTRMDAAAALASVINGDVRVFSFSEAVKEVPPRRGMAGVDAVINSQRHSGTYLGNAVAQVNGQPHDRLIVLTDEQTADRVPDPVARKAYLINVASASHGVGYGKWTHIDGFSESVIRYIHEIESAA